MISRWLSISDQHAIAPRFIFRSIDLFLYYLLFFLFPDFVCFSLSLSLSLSLSPSFSVCVCLLFTRVDYDQRVGGGVGSTNRREGREGQTGAIAHPVILNVIVWWHLVSGRLPVAGIVNELKLIDESDRLERDSTARNTNNTNTINNNNNNKMAGKQALDCFIRIERKGGKKEKYLRMFQSIGHGSSL